MSTTWLKSRVCCMKVFSHLADRAFVCLPVSRVEWRSQMIQRYSQVRPCFLLCVYCYAFFISHHSNSTFHLIEFWAPGTKRWPCSRRPRISPNVLHGKRRRKPAFTMTFHAFVLSPDTSVCFCRLSVGDTTALFQVQSFHVTALTRLTLILMIVLCATQTSLAEIWTAAWSCRIKLKLKVEDSHIDPILCNAWQHQESVGCAWIWCLLPRPFTLPTPGAEQPLLHAQLRRPSTCISHNLCLCWVLPPQVYWPPLKVAFFPQAEALIRFWAEAEGKRGGRIPKLITSRSSRQCTVRGHFAAITTERR